MARPRQFDRDQALLQAIRVFCDKGFAAASTEELMKAMGLSRQSMYNTFGDKRQLYITAMQQYQASSVAELVGLLGKGPTPLASLHNTLLSFASRVETEGTTGCMGVNAICEFGLDDDELNALSETSSNTLRSAFESTLHQAVEQQQISSTDVTGACDFLLATLSGLKISAKAGAGVEQLHAIAGFAIQALRPIT